MDLSCLLSLVDDVAGYQQLKDKLLEAQQSESRLVVPDAAKPYVIAALYQELKLPVLVTTAQPETAKNLYCELQAWCSTSASLHFFPEFDFLSGGYSAVDPMAVTERLQTLSVLAACQNGSLASWNPPLIVSSAVAAATRTVAQADFVAACETLEVGFNTTPLQLLEKWQAIGYQLEDIVELPGTISRRGGIVDVFSSQ